MDDNPLYDESVYAEYAQVPFFEYASSPPPPEVQNGSSSSTHPVSSALWQEQVLTEPEQQPAPWQAQTSEASQLFPAATDVVTPPPVPASSPKPPQPLLRKPRSRLYLIAGILCIVVVIMGSFLTFYVRSSLTTKPHATTDSLAHAFSQAPCPFKPGTGITEGKDLKCGYLTVPEDRQHPGKRSVKLAVAIFKAPVSNPPSDPFIYLSGGPGGALLSDLGTVISRTDQNGYSLDSVTMGHDLILMDQRGTGYSQPSLACPEVDSYNRGNEDRNLSRDAQSRGYVQALQQCHNRLVASGVNLNAYTTIEDANDFHDLIHALGYKQVDLYGVSYGTRLALTVMRLFPNDLRSVILDSTVPPQVNLFTNFPVVTQHAYDTLFQGCAADSVCQQEYPGLPGEFYSLVNKLNAHPVTFQDVRYGTVLLNGDNLANWVYSAMYVTNFIPYLPLAIDEINNGDYRIISRTYGILMLDSHLSYGMYYSVECGEEMAFTTGQQLTQATNIMRPEIRPNMQYSLHTDNSVCQFWGIQPVPQVQKQQVTSSLPTLILSGEFDPITPTSNARIAQKTLSNSYLFIFPATGHGVFLSDTCPNTIITEFIHNPHQKPDTTCISAMQEPDFQ